MIFIIWFVGIYLIFIMQQITIIHQNTIIEKLHYRIERIEQYLVSKECYDDDFDTQIEKVKRIIKDKDKKKKKQIKQGYWKP